MALEHFNYHKIAENGRELLRNDIFDVSFLKKPPAVYFPGDEIISIRTNSVNISPLPAIDSIESNLKGFLIHQSTRVKTNGSITVNLVDREDLSIQYLIESWAQAICDRDTQQSGRKSDLTAEILFTQYNTYRVPIKILKLYNCILKNADLIENNFDATTATNIGPIPITMDFEHYERTILSAPQ